MAESISVFALFGPLTVRVNDGPPFVVNAGARPPDYGPGTVTKGAPGWGALPGPNVMGTGMNLISVTPQIPGFDIPAKKFPIGLPPHVGSLGDSMQLYLALDYTYATVTWIVTVSGQLVVAGNSEQGPFPWPPAPPP